MPKSGIRCWFSLEHFIWSHLNRAKKDAKETAHCKRKLFVTKLFNIVVNDFDANKSARYSRVLVVTELVVSEIQCSGISVFCYPIGQPPVF